MQTKQISEKDTKNIVLFATTSKTVKYFGINLTKGVKFLCNENYMSLMKEMENDTKKWKYIPYSWSERIKLLSFSIPPKAIYRFNTTHLKIPMTLFT